MDGQLSLEKPKKPQAWPGSYVEIVKNRLGQFKETSSGSQSVGVLYLFVGHFWVDVHILDDIRRCFRVLPSGYHSFSKTSRRAFNRPRISGKLSRRCGSFVIFIDKNASKKSSVFLNISSSSKF